MNKGLRDTPTSRPSTEKSRKEHERLFGKREHKTGKTRYMQIDGVLTEVPMDYVPRKPVAPAVFGDITPHQSTITGEMVTTRSRHKQILRESGCIEVGNENQAKYTPKRETNATNAREDLHRALADFKN